SRPGYVEGLLCGLGGGLLIATVLYRHYDVSQLTDVLRVAGFAMFLGALFWSRRLHVRRHDKRRMAQVFISMILAESAHGVAAEHSTTSDRLLVPKSKTVATADGELSFILVGAGVRLVDPDGIGILAFDAM